MTEYEIARAAGRCHVTGRAFEEGEAFHSALFETPQGFERRDYSAQAWQGPPPDAMCHFHSRVPKKDDAKKKLFVDDDVLINFFLRLAESEEAVKLRFRFALCLILLRKRLLRYERTIREADRDYWEMRLMKDKTLHRVADPALSVAEIHELTGELSSVLAGQLPDAGEEAAPSSGEGCSEAAP